jgi:hypothetical protein
LFDYLLKSRSPIAILRWYVVAVLSCTVGTCLAYVGALSSAAWQGYAARKAPVYDTSLAVASAILSALLVWSLKPRDEAAGFLPQDAPGLTAWRRFALWVGGLYILIHAGVIGPWSMRRELIHRLAPPDWLSYRQVEVPYYPYLLYMFGLWLGIVTPVLLALRASYPGNLRWWGQVYGRLVASAQESAVVRAEGAPPVLPESIVNEYNECTRCLVMIADQYGSVAGGVILILLLVQLTPDIEVLTPAAVNAGKIALWFLFLPSCLWIGYRLFRSQRAAFVVAESALRQRASALMATSGEGKDIGSINAALSDVKGGGSPAFFWEICTTQGVLTPLVIFVIAYLVRVKAIPGPVSIARILFPNFVMDWLAHSFGRKPI